MDIRTHLLLPLIANNYEIIPTHKSFVFICSQIFSISNYPYLNVRKCFPKVIIRIFRVCRKFFRVRPCLQFCLMSMKLSITFFYICTFVCTQFYQFKLICFFFFNLVPSSEETSFLTTFYDPYFSHQSLHTYYTLQILSPWVFMSRKVPDFVEDY